MIFKIKMLLFIWRDKKPRVNRCTLYNPKQRGGLGVPDLAKYHYAAQLAQLIRFNTQQSHSLWMQAEPSPISLNRFNI